MLNNKQFSNYQINWPNYQKKETLENLNFPENFISFDIIVFHFLAPFNSWLCRTDKIRPFPSLLDNDGY